MCVINRYSYKDEQKPLIRSYQSSFPRKIKIKRPHHEMRPFTIVENHVNAVVLPEEREEKT